MTWSLSLPTEGWPGWADLVIAPTHGGMARLSWPGWLIKYQDGANAGTVINLSTVPWLRPYRPHTAIPSEHRNESDANAGEPVDDDHEGGEARRAVAAVVVRTANSVVALDSDHQQTEDGDLRQNDDDWIHRETAEEVGRQALDGRQNARYTCPPPQYRNCHWCRTPRNHITGLLSAIITAYRTKTGQHNL